MGWLQASTFLLLVKISRKRSCFDYSIRTYDFFPLYPVTVKFPDPSCSTDTNKPTDDEIVTEGYFKHVTSSSIYILANSVILDAEDDTLNYDPCKDLQVDAINVVVKGTVKWKARSVTINAVNLTIVDDVATLDTSYQSIGTPDFAGTPASPGETPGAAGASGANGGPGGDGGTIDLTMSRLVGGKLILKANGGRGGVGQQGGTGHIGVDGQPNSDRDACCHGRSTRGLKGGPGGNGGNAGVSGSGGNGGVVTVHLPVWADRADVLDRVTMLSGAGASGAQALPGDPGMGGYGGAGSPTGCYNAGHWYDHHWRCHGNLGPDGPRGAEGQKGAPAAPASAGREGADRVIVGGVGKSTPVTMIQLAMREGNAMYKGGRFGAARDVYMWVIDITRNRTDNECIGYRKLATTYLAQIAHGNCTGINSPC